MIVPPKRGLCLFVRLELREVDRTLLLVQHQRQHVALLLKAVGVGHVGDDVVKLLQDHLSDCPPGKHESHTHTLAFGSPALRLSTLQP